MSLCLNDPKDVEDRVARIKRLLAAHTRCKKCDNLLDDFQDVCPCEHKV